MTISELMSDITARNLVLPEFQREYVWAREQAKQLLVSLWRKYPVGGLLIWRTQSPPELKNVKELPEILGTVQVLLDGQQRLTTLYMLITGNIPPYYGEEDIKNDIRDLHFNLEDGDFQYFQPVRMRDNPRWVKVVDCFRSDSVDVFRIAQATCSEDEDGFRVAQTYNTNLLALQNVANANLPIQVVPADASLDQAIDVFDRVNSLGTRLTQAELALTHVTGKWPEARRVVKARIEDFKEKNFSFDLTFMTRALVCAVTGHALFEHIHTVPGPDVEDGWRRLSKILDYIVNLLPGTAYIHATSDISTLNALVPIIQYLMLNDGKFPTQAELRKAVRWFYIAQIRQRYTGQADNRLEHDVTLVHREESPWPSLLDQIVDQRGRIEVNPDDLEGRGTSHPLYRMSYILAKARGAKDWFNGIPLGTTSGGSYWIHSHHVFPASVLYSGLYSSDNHVHRQRVNAIANRAYLTGETNLSISNQIPSEYLPEVEARYPGALESQFIPMDPSLWKIENYEEFLRARRQLIATGINDFLDSFISTGEEVELRPVEELIGLGESSTIEFKSTLQWDVMRDQVNKGLRDMVLKTLTAFMNSSGGTLLIGVEDSGQIYGLERDLSAMGHSEDKFLQVLSSLIADRIGPQYSELVVTKFSIVEGKKVCVLDTSKSSEPVFMKGNRGGEFYVRVGNTTRFLDSEQTLDWIEREQP